MFSFLEKICMLVTSMSVIIPNDANKTETDVTNRSGSSDLNKCSLFFEIDK